uniref:Cytoskeleton protein RodZ n=1 Tax=Candidatus Kentrum sp. TC TaxID=2126339 RepID=A0A450ZZ75_9GAMM|nr:MAG: cytoskeleton protein RodZ [Candidatus Kentron sp. TC]
MGRFQTTMITPFSLGDAAVFTDEEEKGSGEQLREVRRARDLSIEDVSIHLRVSSATIRNLEEEDYHKLPGPVFVRGYLNAYARLLRIPPNRILSAFERHNLTPPTLTRNIVDQSQACGSHILVRVATSLIFLCLIALVFSWWRTTIHRDDYGRYEEFDALLERRDRQIAEQKASEHNPGREMIASIQPSSETSPESAFAADIPPSSLVNTSVAYPASRNSWAFRGNAHSMIRETTIGSMTREAMTLAPATLSPVSEKDHLVVHLSGDSWVEIYDRFEKRLFYQLGSSGQTYEFEGNGPFRVVLGYAHAAKIIYNGKSFDHTPYIHRKVAEFSVKNKPDSVDITR